MRDTTTAFFISRFDDASRFVYESFKEGLRQNVEELAREIELIRIDDLADVDVDHRLHHACSVQRVDATHPRISP